MINNIVVGHRWPLDVERIINVADNHLNLKMSVDEADEIWINHSEKYAAGWLSLPTEDTELAEIIQIELRNIKRGSL